MKTFIDTVSNLGQILENCPPYRCEFMVTFYQIIFYIVVYFLKQVFKSQIGDDVQTKRHSW